jgi:hypothetical protein
MVPGNGPPFLSPIHPLSFPGVQHGGGALRFIPQLSIGTGSVIIPICGLSLSSFVSCCCCEDSSFTLSLSVSLTIGFELSSSLDDLSFIKDSFLFLRVFDFCLIP